MGRVSRVDFADGVAVSSDKTCSRNSLLACASLSEQCLRETEAGERPVSVPLPNRVGNSDPLECILQSLVGEVRVDFGRGDIAVTEGALDEKQVGGSCVEMRREGVPQAMWRYVLCDSGRIQPVLESLSDLPVAEACASCSREERRAFAGYYSAAFLEMVTKQCPKRCLQELDLRNCTFAHDANVLAIQVNVVDVQVYQFRDADPCTEEQFKDDAVAACQWIGTVVEFIEEPALLCFGQELGRCSRQALCGDGLGRTGVYQTTLDSPRKERADHRLEPMHCRGRLGRVVLRDRDCGTGECGVNHRGGDVGDRGDRQRPDKAAQVPHVCRDGVLRAALRPEPDCEVINGLFDVITRLQEPDRIRHCSPPVCSSRFDPSACLSGVGAWRYIPAPAPRPRTSERPEQFS